MFIRIFRRACNYTKAKMKTYTCRYTKRRPFSPSFYVKNYELIPMATICILDGCMVAFCAIRTFFNTDIKFSNHIKTRGEDIELLKEPRCLKFYCPTQEFESNMDLYNLYQEMIEAQKCEDEPDSCERKEGGGWIISADREKKESPPPEGEETPPPEGEETPPPEGEEPEKKLTDAQRKALEQKEKEKEAMKQKQLEQKQKEQLEKDKKDKEQKEKEQKEKERKEKEQKEKEQKEKDRKEKEQKEKERKEKEQKEKERKEKEQKEKERKEKEQKEKKPPEKKKPDAQQKEPEPKPKKDISKESQRGSEASIQSSSSTKSKRESGGGSLSLEQIMKKVVIKEGAVQSPEILFGATVNTSSNRKSYLQNGIQTFVTTSETSYEKGHKMIEAETKNIDTNKKKDTMIQRVITIVHPSGKSDIAMKKFYQEKGGRTVEIKESAWMSAYSATLNIEKVKPQNQLQMTTSVQRQKKEEKYKTTETVTTTKNYPTGAKKIKEEIIVTQRNSSSPPQTTVLYYLEKGGKRSTISENEWEEVDIQPQIQPPKKGKSTATTTQTKTDAKGNTITTTTTTETLANGNQIITTETTTLDNSGNQIGHKLETNKVPKGEKRRLPITGFF